LYLTKGESVNLHPDIEIEYEAIGSGAGVGVRLRYPLSQELRVRESAQKQKPLK
jgi:hypothetical protein